ncbi:phage virion morphogenesis protein [Labrenzia sp. R4_2]|uniref:phage virion morphogenesis protein n=1 Tax=Labrenzia sp. R4_2 TaxID=2821107 RepID=UPI001ADC7AC5|nr:phage virion morphogenesis protein [Labrenzia sp. R4_2]MBO9421718.1 phage virion morphogenesis protein [Labrenzia sp. R4_2]
MLTFRFDTTDLEPEIEELIEKTGDEAMAHKIIGLTLYDQTVDRFMREVGPGGEPWPGLSALTLLNRRSKSGILRDRGELFGSIHHTHSASKAEVGTKLNHPKVHVMQHGALIRPRRAKALRIPAGSNGAVYAKAAVIPPRPYIGIGRDDGAAVKEELIAWLEG